MPYLSQWMPRQEVLEHSGISVCRCYKNGDYEYPLHYYFKAMHIDDWDEEMDEDEGDFDVRELPNWRPVKGNSPCTEEFDEHIKKILMEAIDKNILPVHEQ